ncbi:hypothetical protein AAG570_007018 [Ranatra chinensis]|uniref:RNA-directed DNA polymerase n=1 Tax=Ranatra chinensis TaxID=642074 RepID=A0ABD0YVR8_9HEMI
MTSYSPLNPQTLAISLARTKKSHSKNKALSARLLHEIYSLAAAFSVLLWAKIRINAPPRNRRDGGPAAAASSAIQSVPKLDSVNAEMGMLMNIIKGIQVFDGHSVNLQEFAFLLIAANAQLVLASPTLGEDVGITFITSVADMVSKLRSRYAGARTAKAYVLDWGPQAYQTILGTDALRPRGRDPGSKSTEEHGAHLGQRLERLREFGLRASEEKLSFFQNKLKFMGHSVSARGVATNNAKVEAVKRLPIPKEPKEVKSFQGRGQGVTVCHERYARTQTWTVTIGRTASDDDVLTQLKTFMMDDPTYYAYAARTQDRDRLDRLYTTGSLGGTRWKGVLLRVRTVTDMTEQEQIVREYPVGQTNHRGVTEAVKHLRRRRYWSAMPRTVAKVIAQCKTCAEAKYKRRQKQTIQMLVKPLDVMFWAGQKLSSYGHSTSGTHESLAAPKGHPPPWIALVREATREAEEEWVGRINDERASNRWDRIRVGDTVWIKNWYRRRKEDSTFVGPFQVEKKLVQYRIKVHDVADSRVRFVHINETRVLNSATWGTGPVRSESGA